MIGEKHGAGLRAPAGDGRAAIGVRVARPRERVDFLLQGVFHRFQSQRDQCLDHGQRQAVGPDRRRFRAAGGRRRLVNGRLRWSSWHVGLLLHRESWLGSTLLNGGTTQLPTRPGQLPTLFATGR